MYKLIEHILNGGGSATRGLGYGIITEPVKVIGENDPIPLGYRDISSIQYWNQFGETVGFDYLLTRDMVLTSALKLADTYLESNPEDERDPESIAFNLANSLEKEILARLYISTLEDHLQYFTAEQVKQFRKDHHTKATGTRKERVRVAETLIENELPANKVTVTLDLTSQLLDLGGRTYCIDFHKSYKDFGVLGSVEDYHPIKNPNPGIGLLDYFNNRSLFSATGFLSYEWTPTSLTMEQIAQQISQILTRGRIEA